MLNNRTKSTGVQSMITMFSKPNCPFCEKGKQYLNNLNIEYDAIDITKDPMAHSFLIREGHRTVPQFYKEDELLFEGGYTELIKHTKEQINEMMGDINVNQFEYQL